MSNFDDNREAKRSLILQTAVTLFARMGFSGVGVRNIAEASGCNVAAVSYYFGGKEKLYAECFKLGNPEEIKSLCSILENPESAEDFRLKLNVFCLSFCQHAIKHTELLRLIVSELNSGNLPPEDSAIRKFEPVSLPLRAFFVNGMESKFLKPDVNVVLLSRMLLSGMIAEIVFINERESLEVFVDQLITICTGSIYA